MKKKAWIAVLIVMPIFLWIHSNCKKASEIDNSNGGGFENPMDALKTLTVTSTAFEHGGKIPIGYTCEGQNISPPLEWSTVPSGTHSIAVTFFDINWGFTHMILLNIPPHISSLPEDVNANTPEGAEFGRNTYGASKCYFGPCPDSHDSNNYYFTVYALDSVPNLHSDLNYDQLMAEINGHILAWGELLGKYH
jgi:Raf kinase inhibitor-like YbhB/YbcL family protein